MSLCWSGCAIDVAKNRTASAELEAWLNTTYDPGTALYDDLARVVTDGIKSRRRN
jgi:hypothetical protein